MLLGMKRFIAGMVLVAACTIVRAEEPFRPTDLSTVALAQSESVRPGIEVFLSAVPERIRGKRIGLITNHAGIDRAGASDIDLLAAHPNVKLVALFAAEHGIRGVAAAGEKVADDRDPTSGLPIFQHWGGADNRADRELASLSMVRRYRSPMAQPLTESEIAGCLEQLPGHCVFRGNEPDGGTRDGSSLRAGGCTVARCACSREDDE